MPWNQNRNSISTTTDRHDGDIEKCWCRIKWSTIRGIIEDRRDKDRVLPVEMDGTRIDGREPVDFAIRPKGRSGRAIANLILTAYKHRELPLPPFEGSPGHNVPSGQNWWHHQKQG
uniref:Uncharacterized protein n=1 Tax=Candidatus Kentrum sp. FW TaxID=2126338 RepID=A0A450SKV4_9GAMM|nr:MAG: hypothetical protein BECKFW1821A_GA0114235_10469 [Candidatus Kentron sp. FW]